MADVLAACRTELSERIGITLANLSFLCSELDCQPGDLLVNVDEADHNEPGQQNPHEEDP